MKWFSFRLIEWDIRAKSNHNFSTRVNRIFSKDQIVAMKGGGSLRYDKCFRSSVDGNIRADVPEKVSSPLLFHCLRIDKTEIYIVIIIIWWKKFIFQINILKIYRDKLRLFTARTYSSNISKQFQNFIIGAIFFSINFLCHLNLSSKYEFSLSLAFTFCDDNIREKITYWEKIFLIF